MDQVNWATVRSPCPAESRLVVRHRHKFYNNLVVAGIYQFPATGVARVETYASALRACIQQYGFLSVATRKDRQGKDIFVRPSHIDIRNHFHLIEHDGQKHHSSGSSSNDDLLIAQAFEQICNDKDLSFFDTADRLPAWRLNVFPLESSAQQSRALLAFAYSHAIGDGMSGVAFHKTFSKAMRRYSMIEQDEKGLIVETTTLPLASVPHLPISFLYLLGPALGHYLPRFLSRALGLKASSSGSDEGTWTGPNKFLNALDTVAPVPTAVEIASISGEVLAEALQSCRKHGTKLSSFLQEVIAKSFNRHLAEYYSLDDRTNFISATPVNLRKAAGVDEDCMGNFSSAAFTRHEIDHNLTANDSIEVTDAMWSAARIATTNIAKTASTLNNHPIGLLSWVSDLNGWMSGQIGQARDSSWELSNLMSFEGQSDDKDDLLVVEKMYFCQPADAVGQPLTFNVVSIRGSDLVICSSWQIGALGFNSKDDQSTETIEREFVLLVLKDIVQFVKVAAGGGT